MSKQFGMVIDLKKCIGCHTCTIACKLENRIRKGSWITVDTIGGPYMDTPTGKYPKIKMHFFPRMCYHCREPRCLPACPAEAIYKREDGVILIDENKCTGCKLCIKACPYKMPAFNSRRNVVEKCTLCAHRLDKGLPPFCVICCQLKAITFGNVNDPKSETSKLIKQRNAHTVSPEHGTQPSVYYCT